MIHPNDCRTIFVSSEDSIDISWCQVEQVRRAAVNISHHPSRCIFDSLSVVFLPPSMTTTMPVQKEEILATCYCPMSRGLESRESESKADRSSTCRNIRRRELYDLLSACRGCLFFTPLCSWISLTGQQSTIRADGRLDVAARGRKKCFMDST